MRTARIVRNTSETKISVSLCLEGTGKYKCDTGSGFLDHMLSLFARHGRFDLEIKCEGDIQVDYHHTVEDAGIAIGMAFAQAAGDFRGITRYGSVTLPMDEALVLIAADISGRAHLSFDAVIPAQKTGDFDTELVEEFMLGFVRAFGITLHIRQLAGKNSHHIIEAMFKGLGRVISQALTVDESLNGEIPSTKGIL